MMENLLVDTKLMLVSDRMSANIAKACLFSVIMMVYVWYAPAIILNQSLMVDPQINMSSSGEGDSLRQICFLLVFGTLVGTVYLSRGARALLEVPSIFILLLAWCWLSVTWAIEPTIALRRIAFTTILILSLVYAIRMMTYRSIIDVLLLSFVIILLFDWVAVLLCPLAIHQASEADKSLIGNWRGVQNHKNEAGAFCAISCILFLHETVRLRAYTGVIWSVAAAGFLYMTQSKTSGVLMIIGLLAGVCAQYGFIHPRIRNTLLGFGIVALVFYLSFADQQIASLVQMLDDPSSLTGRTQIWPVLLDYATDHPLLGAGYGSFWAIGDASPIFVYGSGWLTGVDHAHNGYLDLLVQIGGIGLILAISGLVLRPLYIIFFRSLDSEVSRSLLAAIFTYVSLHDLLETSILDRAASTWVVMVIMYCLLVNAERHGDLARID
jgi:exopolysaccharide production protein ExoQ